MIHIEPIAVVRNGVSSERDDGWGQVESVLEVAPHLRAGLRGLDGFSHVVVVYWMHQARFDAARDLVRRPRGRADMPELGIFAQRAKHRPNPIGLTACPLVALEEAGPRVRGLDAIDGTPVLDLKPHVPAFDAPDAARLPGWIGEIMKGYF